MLSTMLTVFLLGTGLLGGAMLNPAEVGLIDEHVERLVDNPQSAADAQKVLAELRAEVENFDRIFFDTGDDLRDLYLDHHAPAWQMQRSLELINLEWYKSQQRSLKLRDRLRESIAADEWAVIFGN